MKNEIMSCSSSNHRRDTDMRKLMKAGYTVEPSKDKDSNHKFYVYFNGPQDSLYSGGAWKVLVILTEKYPDESPIIRFVTKIYHPNITLDTGLPCVDLLEGVGWNPEYDLVTVFDLILPQLLVEPNPFDPINTKAAGLLLKDESAYEEKVKEYRDRYANPGQ